MKAWSISSGEQALIPIENIRRANAMFVQLDLKTELLESQKAESRLLRHEIRLLEATIIEQEKRYSAQGELLRISNMGLMHTRAINLGLEREVRRQKWKTYGIGAAAFVITTFAILN